MHTLWKKVISYFLCIPNTIAQVVLKCVNCDDDSGTEVVYTKFVIGADDEWTGHYRWGDWSWKKINVTTVTGFVIPGKTHCESGG